MKLSLNKISGNFPSYRGHIGHTVEIEDVFTDTRKKAHRAIFIPIVGGNFDGHDFLKDAINQGAIATFWQKDKPVPAFVPTDFPMFFVEDTITALQDLAKLYLKEINPYVIGITGSNGKTTTKDLVYEVVSKKYRTHKTFGNLNNHIGVPLTILGMNTDTEVLIVEMGMNNFGEISVLSKLSEPDFGIITNIGESHIEFLGSREGIATAKLEIKDGLKDDGSLIIDGDEILLTRAKDLPKQTITCGLDGANEYQLSFILTTDNGVQFFINGEKEPYELNMIGNHNVKNALYAIVVGRELKVSKEEIREALKNVKVTGMRMERILGKNNATLINDAYNASPTSMRAAIETLKTYQTAKRRIAVLGDMFELGEDEEALHKSVVSVIEPPITDVIVIGEKAKWIGEEMKERDLSVNVLMFKTKEEVKDELLSMLDKDTVVLFKASRGAKFETLISQLQEK